MNPYSLKAAGCRVLARLAGAHGRSDERGELFGTFNTLLLPSSNNLLCNLESKPFFAIAFYHLRNFCLTRPIQPIRRRFATRGVHPHVERPVLAEAEAPLTFIQLRRRHADVEQHAVGDT